MNDHALLLQQVLACYGLARATLHPLHSYNNFVYRVETTAKQRFSLRISGFANMKRRSMEDEMIWLDFVAKRNPRLAPRPIPNAQGEWVTSITTPAGERLSSLFAWVEGRELRSALTPADLHKIGRSVAELHNIAREFAFPDATSDFRSDYRYDQALMQSHRDWIDKRRTVIGPDNMALLDRAIDYVVAAMDRIGTTPATYGMIHADLSFGNLLEQAGEIYFIDFEQLGRGHFLYDLAVLRAELLEGAPELALHWQSFIAGYGEVAALPFYQEEALQPFIVATQLNFLDWFYNSMRPEVQAEKSALLPTVYAALRQQVSLG